MKFIRKNCIAIVIILICIMTSIPISLKYSYEKSKVIDYYVIINILISLFSVSLAIVALMISILEKYKEKTANQQAWANGSTELLKKICENTVALLLLIMLLAFVSVLEPIITIPKFDFMTAVLLFSLFLSLVDIFDTTICVYKLVVNLKGSLSPANSKEINLSQKEIHLIEAYRFLDDEHKANFEGLVKALATNQEIENDNRSR
ncbi:MAG: hypothetical protein HFH38_04970 [Lachnospiraceae bacterium]|jgi:hypothetical protein|nr:hypothetical protein [Lachnospiraceae bacterium]